MKNSDNQKFNEMLQNLLKMPPKPHEAKAKKPRKQSVNQSGKTKGESAARKDKRSRP